MPVAKVCDECGSSYRVPPSRAATSRFCCIACANAAKVVTPRRSYYKPRPGGLKCAICGGEFWALGVHVKHKHGICAKDYKAEYGLLLTRPLVHPEISEALRDSAKRRLLDPDYHAEVTERCKENSEANKGKNGCVMKSSAASDLVAQRNKERNDQYLKSIASKVQEALDRTGFVSHVARELHVGAQTIRGMAQRGLVSIPVSDRRRLVPFKKRVLR